MRLNIQEAEKIMVQEHHINPQNATILLFQNYSDILQIMVTENQNLYFTLKKNQDVRLSILKKESKKSPWKRFIEAEIRYQWALAKLQFGDEISAAWDLKQSYNLLIENQKLFPEFVHHKKLLGLFHIFIGSVPEKYEWLPAVLGFKGKVVIGLEYLNKVESSKTIFSQEAAMLLAATQKYILKKSTCISCNLEPYLKRDPQNLLLRYLLSGILVKEGNSDKAFQILTEKVVSDSQLQFPMMSLLSGEILLYKGDYQNARKHLFDFRNSTKGRNHIKDVYYKIFLSYWLNNEDQRAYYWQQQVIKEGQSVYDADKFAEKFAKQKQLPDKILMKARLASDGGYLDQALKELSKYCIHAQTDHHDNIEFWYRKGRIYQLQGRTIDAKEYYQRVIHLSEGKNYYYAPNACLQLGYIYRDEKNVPDSKKYFQQAITYKDHEYKNSIDNKAIAALNELGK